MTNTNNACSILVVEDDIDIGTSLKDGLSMLGYTVNHAENGKEALEILTKIEKPKLILLDLMMPVMDGSEFRAKQKTDPRIADIPVVLITADSNPDQKAKNLEADLALKKPLDFENLFNIVDSYCN